MNKNTIKKAMKVKQIVDRHYQPQSHRDCMRDIFRKHVIEVYPMCESTFYRLIRIAIGIDGYVGNGSNRVYRPKKEMYDSGTV